MIKKIAFASLLAVALAAVARSECILGVFNQDNDIWYEPTCQGATLFLWNNWSATATCDESEGAVARCGMTFLEALSYWSEASGEWVEIDTLQSAGPTWFACTGANNPVLTGDEEWGVFDIGAEYKFVVQTAQVMGVGIISTLTTEFVIGS